MSKVIDIGQYIEVLVNWLTDNLKPLFDVIKNTGNSSILGIEWVLLAIPFFIVIALFTSLAWWKSGKGVAVTTLVGLTLIYLMGFWRETMETLALVLVATLTALVASVSTRDMGCEE
ncbi:hypothetical protein ACFX5U_17365 [Sphingobacterium sp. SG20118]|uniref:hypothetical protein n=1 Tax=Sphingobacterium sp. SG20118 TaxID=3367156 RepID=UPI0037DFC60A